MRRPRIGKLSLALLALARLSLQSTPNLFEESWVTKKQKTTPGPTARPKGFCPLFGFRNTWKSYYVQHAGDRPPVCDGLYGFQRTKTAAAPQVQVPLSLGTDRNSSVEAQPTGPQEVVQFM